MAFSLLKNVRQQASTMVLVCLCAVFFFSTDASAKGEGLSVSPLRTELTISPGTTAKGTLTITNATDADMGVTLSSEIFSVINPEYDYSFSQDSDVTEWVQFTETSINLSPEQTKTVTYDIAVPLGAEPGGRYISIFASTDSEEQQGAITSRQRIASLLYVTVDGDVTREGYFLSLSAPWWVGQQTDWSATLRNTGTTHFRSRYTIQVQSIWSTDPVAQTTGESLVLPGTIRRISDTLPLPPYPGIYKVSYVIGLGDQPAHVDSRVMIYIPVWVWPIVGLASLLIVALWTRRRRH